MRISWPRGSVVLQWDVSSFRHIIYSQSPFNPIFRHAVAAVLWAKDGRLWNRDQHLGSYHAGKNCGHGDDYFLDSMLAWKTFVWTSMLSMKINETDLFIRHIRIFMCVCISVMRTKHSRRVLFYGNRAGQMILYLTIRLITASANVDSAI